METFRFRNFQVYKDAKGFNVKIFRVSKSFALELRSQIVRSALSIVLNIAEGSAKKSDKDFNRYIENALGSVNETVAALEVVLDIELISLDLFSELLTEAEAIAKQLGGLSKKLKSG